ncbi:NUDIX hydrolase domain-like protein [Plectosphaerella plurivora]|uniref:NUDIX hydrolase domain-like protein n=1 Tax=Plectosphaerella plurivora TaxID=936078 RepID=A0A9P9ABK6_9PEZI|nr:NUDIX hydrolase domain-like protein [Plectosphaerella plurivora]
MDLLDSARGDVFNWANTTLHEDYDKITVGAAIIRVENDSKSILLLKRNANERYFPGVFEIPGGQMEYGEKVCNAVSREVAEETGMTVMAIVSAMPWMKYTTNKQRNETQWVRRTLQLSYIVVVEDETTCTVNEDEHSEFVWANEAALQELPMTDEMRLLVFAALRPETMSNDPAPISSSSGETLYNDLGERIIYM